MVFRIDIDLERGGELANRAKANALFSRIYSTVKAKGASLHVNICLPGMTSVGGSVGGENWCVYADLDAYCDTAAIMSYGMSWAGSAPDRYLREAGLKASTVMLPMQ